MGRDDVRDPNTKKLLWVLEIPELQGEFERICTENTSACLVPI